MDILPFQSCFLPPSKGRSPLRPAQPFVAPARLETSIRATSRPTNLACWKDAPAIFPGLPWSQNIPPAADASVLTTLPPNRATDPAAIRQWEPRSRVWDGRPRIVGHVRREVAAVTICPGSPPV